MARKKHSESSAAETLEEIQSFGDRLAEWISANPALVLGSAIGILVIAGAYGLARNAMESSRDRASAELAAVDDGYRRAMGASPDSYAIPEPANPDAARSARERFVGEYLAVAEEHAGSSTGALAALAAGRLQSELGQADAALETWTRAAESLGDEDTVRALLLERIATAHESDERWAEAAEAHLAAAEIRGFPLRLEALADAARCYAEAGNEDAALAAYDRLASDPSGMPAPPHIRALIEELRARRETG